VVEEYFSTELGRLYLGDALEFLRGLPDESVDLVLTDPPYNISSDAKVVMKNHPKQKRSQDRYLTYDFGEWDHFKTEGEYFRFTRKWVREVYRILKPEGNFVSFYDSLNLYVLKKIWERLGGRPRQPLYWLKKNPKPRLRKVDFRVAVESMFWGAKSEKGHIFNWQLGQQDNYVVCAVFLNKERTGHPTQKPTPVLEPWIRYLSRLGGLVVDPFIGSGTTAVAAERLGRRWLGCDNNREYLDMAVKRLRPFKSQTKLEV